MKSEDNTGNSRNGNANTESAKEGTHTNTIEVGSVGIEGGSDNGASTLRVLKRKHANDPASKRPAKQTFL